jgi:hypothetical protein
LTGDKIEIYRWFVADGYSIQLTRQIGEHMITSRLGRMGYIAAPFAGNVPLFDLMAGNRQGYAIPVQIKTANKPSWQYNANHLLDIKVVGDRQFSKGRLQHLNPNLIYIFILVKEQEDDFYIARLRDIQNITQRLYFGDYKSIVRRKNPKSFHCYVTAKDLKKFHNNWELIGESFRVLNT